MENSYNKDTFCIAPWMASHLNTFNTAIPCCIYKAKKPFGEMKKGTPFFNHYNSEEAIRVRKALWEGEKIEECNECWFREQSAPSPELSDSYRSNINDIFKEYIDDAILNTNDDFTLKEPRFRLLDLRFDNKCNLKCRICTPNFSSALFKEFKELKFYDWNVQESAYNISVDDNEYSFIIDQLKHVKVLFFAGGEPLTQDKHYEILQYCIDNDYAKDITIWVTTNFTKLKYKNYDLISMWKHFKKVEVTASIDASYARNDYMRDGSNWDDIVANRIKLKEEFPEAIFMIVPTVTIMNSYNVVDLYKEWLELGYIKPGMIHVNLLSFPLHMQLCNLPEHHKSKVRKLYQDTIEWIDSNIESERCKEKDISQFRFLLEILNKERSEEQFQKFIQRTKQVDKYRGNDFFKDFPEFSDFLVV